jgi:hypothetical protein
VLLLQLVLLLKLMLPSSLSDPEHEVNQASALFLKVRGRARI